MFIKSLTKQSFRKDALLCVSFYVDLMKTVWRYKKHSVWQFLDFITFSKTDIIQLLWSVTYLHFSKASRAKNPFEYQNGFKRPKLNWKEKESQVCLCYWNFQMNWVVRKGPHTKPARAVLPNDLSKIPIKFIIRSSSIIFYTLPPKKNHIQVEKPTQKLSHFTFWGDFIKWPQKNLTNFKD